MRIIVAILDNRLEIFGSYEVVIGVAIKTALEEENEFATNIVKL